MKARRLATVISLAKEFEIPIPPFLLAHSVPSSPITASLQSDSLVDSVSSDSTTDTPFSDQRSTETQSTTDAIDALFSTVVAEVSRRSSTLAKERDASTRMIYDLQQKLLFLQKMKERLQISIQEAHSKKDEQVQSSVQTQA